MPEQNEKNLKKLEELLKIINEGVTKDEFEKAFQKVIELVLKIEKRNSEAVAKLEETYHTLLSKMTQDGESRHKELSGKVDRVFVGERMDKMEQDHKAMMTEMKDMVMGMIDKKMTKMEGHVAGLKPMQGMKGDKGDTGPMPTEHLDLMKQMMAEMKKVQNILTNIPRGKTVGRAKSQIIRAVDLSADVDGVVTTYTLPPDTVQVLFVWSTQFPQILRPTIDFTFAGRTLTLTAQVGVIQSGQSLTALVETLFYP